jgi:hypothetical protein
VHEPAFDRIVLLTNYDYEHTQHYAQWLEKVTECVGTDLYHVDLSSPIDYSSVYSQVCAQLKQSGLGFIHYQTFGNRAEKLGVTFDEGEG